MIRSKIYQSLYCDFSYAILTIQKKGSVFEHWQLAVFCLTARLFRHIFHLALSVTFDACNQLLACS